MKFQKISRNRVIDGYLDDEEGDLECQKITRKGRSSKRNQVLVRRIHLQSLSLDGIFHLHQNEVNTVWRTSRTRRWDSGQDIAKIEFDHMLDVRLPGVRSNQPGAVQVTLVENILLASMICYRLNGGRQAAMEASLRHTELKTSK